MRATELFHAIQDTIGTIFYDMQNYAYECERHDEEATIPGYLYCFLNYWSKTLYHGTFGTIREAFLHTGEVLLREYLGDPVQAVCDIEEQEDGTEYLEQEDDDDWS